MASIRVINDETFTEDVETFETYLDFSYGNFQPTWRSFERISYVNVVRMNPRKQSSVQRKPIEDIEKELEHKKELSKGSFGVVNLMRDVRNDLVYAVKKVDVNAAERKNLIIDDLMKEAEILKDNPHEHIVHLYQCIFVNREFRYFYFVMEYIEGQDLSKKISSRRETPFEKDLLRWFHQVLRAVAHIHSNNIIHHDIKPENIMLTSDGHIKLIDFGLSSLKVRAGTPCYFSPEKANNEKRDEKLDDIWAVGCTYLELMMNRRLERKLSLGDRFLDDSLQKCSETFADLTLNVQKCLKSSDCRPQAQDILVSSLELIVVYYKYFIMHAHIDPGGYEFAQFASNVARRPSRSCPKNREFDQDER